MTLHFLLPYSNTYLYPYSFEMSPPSHTFSIKLAIITENNHYQIHEFYSSIEKVFSTLSLGFLTHQNITGCPLELCAEFQKFPEALAIPQIN